MASTRKSILMMGLIENPDPSTGFTADKVKQLVQDQLQKAKEAGYDITPHFVDLTHPSPVEPIIELLRAQHWDGVAIGHAVRSIPDLTPFFEELMNRYIQESQPLPKLIFPVGPGNALEAIQRVFSKAN